MRIAESREDKEKWVKFLRSHPKGHFMQSPEWAAVKSNWKNVVVLSEGPDGVIEGGMSLLIRPLPVFGNLIYCPRGPVCGGDPRVLGDLTEGVRRVMETYNAVGARIEPDIEETDSEWLGAMEGLGWVRRPPKNAGDMIQPRSLFRLDLRGRTEEELLAGFHKKLRYNIGLAARRGVEITEGGVGYLSELCRLMEVTARRDGFVARDAGYFKRLWDAMAPEHAQLLLAKYEGETVAAGLFVTDCGRTWYVYGASSNERRNLMPCHLLQWEAIRRALARGDASYDLRGFLETENDSSGLYRFKRQFGADLVRLAGELYLTDSPIKYRLYRRAEYCYHSLLHLYSKAKK